MLLVLPALWRYTRFENCEYFNGPFGFIYQIAPVTWRNLDLQDVFMLTFRSFDLRLNLDEVSTYGY